MPFSFFTVLDMIVIYTDMLLHRRNVHFDRQTHSPTQHAENQRNNYSGIICASIGKHIHLRVHMQKISVTIAVLSPPRPLLRADGSFLLTKWIVGYGHTTEPGWLDGQLEEMKEDGIWNKPSC